MTQARGSLVFGIGIGLVVAFFAYRWAGEPIDRTAREREEQVVLRARDTLHERLQLAGLELIDPLLPNRRVGKVYIYPTADGWEVSGFYRRDSKDRWHPWLMQLDREERLQKLRVQDGDPAIARIAASDPTIQIAD
ncbi:MAG TPA: hypothetical protein PKK10_07185 [Woeseiaceae bacterium]|nr:hypothetical protein [Woeseiaceae bacterium]